MKRVYELDDPNNNMLLRVSVNKLDKCLSKDSPEFYVSPNTKNGDSIIRINSCLNYLKHNQVLNPPQLLASFGKIGVIDGRHRIALAKKMGYQYINIEIPQDQKNIFIKLS